MINNTISSEKLREFVETNIKSDPSSLLLKYHDKDLEFDLEFALIQISSRRKTEKKLKSFINYKYFLFPNTISAEQASHELVAKFHASLIGTGDTVLDMTAGLGIDAMSMARNAKNVIACELDESKADILSHNIHVLNLNNITVLKGDSIRFLKSSDREFDTIFIDPARRDSNNSRTYNFRDCQPDILEIQDEILENCERLLIKASPLLDISQTLKEIKNIIAVRVICVEGECKEILIESQGLKNSHLLREKSLLPDSSLGITVGNSVLKEAIDLTEKEEEIVCFSYVEPIIKNEKPTVVYATEDDLKESSYLYEPNAAMMKLSPWSELCRKYEGLRKLAPSSHLFISKELYPNFPGRKLKIMNFIGKKDRKTIKGLPANVCVRNYPLTAEELRKQLGVTEGKDTFIYGTKLNKPVLILAERLLDLG